MNIHTAGLSDKGLVREDNEDAFFIDESIGFFMVADGVGGNVAGEIASRLAVEFISNYILKTLSSGNEISLAEAINAANEAVNEAGRLNSDLKGMATTVVAALARENHLTIANIGDSRAYLIRNRTIEQVTEDHSLVAENVRKGLLSKEEAKTAGDKNVITRALGSGLNGDRLVLYTNGLNDAINGDRILEFDNPP